eukprot:1537329-Alexandrium_andersonii.AAC.1
MARHAPLPTVAAASTSPYAPVHANDRRRPATPRAAGCAWGRCCPPGVELCPPCFPHLSRARFQAVTPSWEPKIACR